MHVVRGGESVRVIDVDDADVVRAVVEAGDLVRAVAVRRAARRRRLSASRIESHHHVRHRLAVAGHASLNHRVRLELNVCRGRRSGSDFHRNHF